MKAASTLTIVFATVGLCLSQQQSPPVQAQLAHFHHVHINAVDPEASIRFYTTRFNSERAKLGGTIDAVWAQRSWLLFNKVSRPAPSEIVSSIYHIDWGAEDMKAEYQHDLPARRALLGVHSGGFWHRSRHARRDRVRSLRSMKNL